ncbi:hypothetical protein BMS3Abin16_01767 [archaeon BMS3Abin16]|nr:hypothetical protein BMS3Abin16_01767 [archaeon BMS3Abin16]
MKGIYKIIILLLISLTLLSAGVAAYTIDGDTSDWGLNLATDAWSLPATWVPIKTSVDWIVEDNIDGATYPGHTDWSGYSATGVHIKGVGPSYAPYSEPKTSGWIPPTGGEHYDIEALYFDDDRRNAYFLIITSMPDGTTGIIRGDLALDVDGNPATGDKGFEYGVKLTGADKGKVYENPDWIGSTGSGRVPYDGPVSMKSGTGIYVGDAELATASLGVIDNGRGNYVIEMAILKGLIGAPAQGPSSGGMHTSLTCANDIITLGEFVWDFPYEIPEFATTAIPAFIAIGGYLALRRRREE